MLMLYSRLGAKVVRKTEQAAGHQAAHDNIVKSQQGQQGEQ